MDTRFRLLPLAVHCRRLLAPSQLFPLLRLQLVWLYLRRFQVLSLGPWRLGALLESLVEALRPFPALDLAAVVVVVVWLAWRKALASGSARFLGQRLALRLPPTSALSP